MTAMWLPVPPFLKWEYLLGMPSQNRVLNMSGVDNIFLVHGS